jgi:hypothetical protein
MKLVFPESSCYHLDSNFTIRQERGVSNVETN